MMVYPLSRNEQRVVVWGGRVITATALLMIGLLAAISLAA
jgi:hypothetical protein